MPTQLYRYIFRQCFWSIVSVLTFVITLHLLLRFADIRTLSWDRLKPIFYELPNTILLFMPIAILIGGLLAMGGMNSRNEITALRASGASRIACSIPMIVISLGLALFMMLTMELLTPRLYQGMGLKNPNQFQTSWLQFEDYFWKITHNNHNQSTTIDAYHVDDSRQIDAGIVGARKINSAALQVPKQHYWLLPEQLDHINSNIDAMMLTLPVPDSLTRPISDQQLKYGLQPSAAWQKVQSLKQQRQPYKEADNALWRMLLLPLTYISVAMIVLPFVFSTGRQINTGKRLFIGVIIGLCFYIVSRLIGSLSLVYPIPAILSIALSPILLIVIATKMLTQRL